MKILRFTLWSLVALTLVGAGSFFAISFQRSQTPDRAALYDTAVDTIGGPFELVRADTGETVTEADFADKPKAIFFGFTYCPDVCPLTLFELAAHLDAMGEEADNLNVMMITVDPQRDTPEFLEQYVSAFSDKIVGLTGTQDAIDDVVENFRVYARQVPLDDGDYTMDHSASVFLMNADNALVGTISYQESPAVALAKLERLARLRS